MCTSLHNHCCDLTGTPSHKGHRNSLLMWEIISKPEEPCERQSWSLSRTMYTEPVILLLSKMNDQVQGNQGSYLFFWNSQPQAASGTAPIPYIWLSVSACNFLWFFAFSKVCEADSKTTWQTLPLLLTLFFVNLKGRFAKAGLRYLWTLATVLWCHWGKTEVTWERVYSVSPVRKLFGGGDNHPEFCSVIHLSVPQGTSQQSSQEPCWCRRHGLAATPVCNSYRGQCAEGFVTFTFLWPWLLVTCSSL